MSLQAVLDRGLAAAPDCRAVCCVDLESGIILAKSLRAPLPQEQLDRLATLGQRMIEGLAPPPADIASGHMPQATGALVCLLGESATIVFTRAQSTTDHFLCYSCDAGADTAALTAAVDQNRKDVVQVMS